MDGPDVRRGRSRYPGTVLVLVALTLLHGVVRIGPATPVCQAGVPCDKPAAGVTLTFTRRERTVRAKTDRSGRYSVRLVPGTWSVRARAGVRISPMAFLVPRTSTATRNFLIDTGIR